MRRGVRSAVLALVALGVAAPVALAHPLGNFTVNHYAGIRVEPDRVLLDVVIDAAEIPTFQLVAARDLDGDGILAGPELQGLAAERCLVVGRDLALGVDGAAVPLAMTAAGIAFPAGNGGLATMRLSCGYEAAAVVGAGTAIAFRDDHEAARIGWREIAVAGSGTTVTTPGLDGTSPSARLTAYPDSLASAPDERELWFEVRVGGPELEPFSVPGTLPVGPIDVATGAPLATDGEHRPAEGPRAPDPAPSVPGTDVALGLPTGAEPIPDLLRAAPVDPLLALAALLVAAALGAGHALTPGHGKTLMAAYLVGTRGGRRHAIGLGLAVAISHTAGILVLAGVVLAAERALPVDVVVRAAPIVAAVSIVIVGGWMLVGELRRRLAARRQHAIAHAQGHAHGHGAHDHGHGAHDHPHAADPLEHSHGGVRHSHAPAAGTRVTWRSLFLLGLAGGLIPSASALLLLLGTIAAGRPAWGVVLVAAFGVGMAGVMTGIGLALVFARERVERSAWRLPVARLSAAMPLATGSLVLVLGVVLTTQAIAAAGV